MKTLSGEAMCWSRFQPDTFRTYNLCVTASVNLFSYNYVTTCHFYKYDDHRDGAEVDILALHSAENPHFESILGYSA
jgi:hypothetical protein